MIIPNWHPFLVHFSIGLLSISVIIFVVARLFFSQETRRSFDVTARNLLFIGCGMTVFTVAAGFYAFYTVDHDTPSHEVMKLHRNLGLVTTILFLSLAWILRKRGKPSPSDPVRIGMVVALLFLGSTGWYGGELVYRHGIGVMSLPAVSGDGHDHDHGSEQSVDDNSDDHQKEFSPEAISDALYEALRTGNVGVIKTLLDEDVMILEGGHAQRSRVEYMSGHMLSDMEFLPNTQKEILDRTSSSAADIAWITTKSRTTGEFKGQVLDKIDREFLLMKYDGEAWRIILIHWGDQ